mgnify:CR=1 FL=1
MQPSLFDHITPNNLSKIKDAPASSCTLDSLNQAQREAVLAPDGPVLVIAGAGSGKTRTLVHRLAHLVERGVAPESLMLLTFTRKAAQEMIARAGSLLSDSSCRRVTGGTFHATANLLLRRHAACIGYQANFTILDQSDAEGIINLLKSSLGLGKAGRRFPSRRMILGVLSKAVNTGKSPSDLVEGEYPHLLEFLDDLLAIAEHYRQFKLSHGLMDYDDLLVNWRKLLREQPQVRQELASRFQAILVDEYQDTNPIQAEIVRLLAAPRNNVMAVGDDAQSIYSFRGADFRNIMEFPKQFPGTRIIRLEQNYRSTPEILQLSNAIIAPAPEQYRKELFSKLSQGPRPVLHVSRNEGSQARFVVEKIRGLLEEGVAAEDIAVLFRSGFHSYKLELELASHAIPFEKRGGLKLTESAHIKDVLGYLRVLCNPSDRLSWNRILLLLDKIGPKTAGAIIDAFPSGDSSQVLEPPLGTEPSEDAPTGSIIERHLEVLRGYPAGKGWGEGLKKLIQLLEDMQGSISDPLNLLELVLSYYQPVFLRLYPDDYPRRQRDLDQLRPLLSGYTDLRDFLADTALDPPSPDAKESWAEPGRVILSTVHSAKGLEWDTVFIIHLVEGKFPSTQAEGDEEYEEERRLFYVAATRAKRNLFLLYPREVSGYDKRPAPCKPSSLLDEVPHRLLELGQANDFVGSVDHLSQQNPWEHGHDLPWGAGKKGWGNTVSKTLSKSEELTPGARVKHPFFGPGVLLKKLDAHTVEVNFDRHGRKTLHLDYAKLGKL